MLRCYSFLGSRVVNGSTTVPPTISIAVGRAVTGSAVNGVLYLFRL